MGWFRKHKQLTVSERVSNGFALLDNAKPGWHRGVCTYALDIANSYWCALGQTYGSYGQGLNALNIGARHAGENGFVTTHYLGDTDLEYELLTAEWRRQINERLDTERAAWAEQYHAETGKRFGGWLSRR
jgi:hypothetical protein